MHGGGQTRPPTAPAIPPSIFFPLFSWAVSHTASSCQKNQLSDQRRPKPTQFTLTTALALHSTRSAPCPAQQSGLWGHCSLQKRNQPGEQPWALRPPWAALCSHTAVLPGDATAPPEQPEPLHCWSCPWALLAALSEPAWLQQSSTGSTSTCTAGTDVPTRGTGLLFSTGEVAWATKGCSSPKHIQKRHIHSGSTVVLESCSRQGRKSSDSKSQLWTRRSKNSLQSWPRQLVLWISTKLLPAVSESTKKYQPELIYAQQIQENFKLLMIHSKRDNVAACILWYHLGLCI